ncbi:hypothetical protein K458DRAFT_276780, partial [Lentithecium fluviatile CBS 122367]
MNPISVGEGPRNASSPRGGTLLVSLYVWTCLVVMAGIARMIIAVHQKIDFGSDDATALAGSVVYLGATASWHVAINAGLGKHAVELSDGHITRYFKAAYAAQLLQIATIGLAKTSSIFLIERVSSQTRKVKATLHGLVGFWFVYSVLAFGLQCGLPMPWEVAAGKCARGGPLVSVIAINMISDLVIAGWILPTLWPLKMDKGRRLIVGFLFGARAGVALVAGGQAWAAARAMQSDDPTWNGFELAIFNQAVTSLSLIVATLPRIKRFLDTGGGDDLRPRITETEIALSTLGADGSSGTGVESLKLVPGSIAKITTTVMATGDRRKKERLQPQQEWEKFTTMGTLQDEHTSTSSLFEHRGVMMQQEVTVQVE